MMAFKIVQCEVRWVARVGYSGNEIPPATYETIGEYEDEDAAVQAMLHAGLVRDSFGFWRSVPGYALGYITRQLRELE